MAGCYNSVETAIIPNSLDFVEDKDSLKKEVIDETIEFVDTNPKADTIDGRKFNLKFEPDGNYSEIKRKILLQKAKFDKKMAGK